MQRWFDSLTGFADFGNAGVFPAINLTETGDSIRVRAELPGIELADLDVTVENDTLVIAGERKMASESDEASYHRREREWGTFRRSFSLPSRVDATGVKARYRDGILTVELPKAAEARPRQIAVEAGR
jgi:HSP20 family protein